MAEPNSIHESLPHAASPRSVAVAAGAACLPGAQRCRHIDNAQVDVLESELRKQEDYIYELEEYLMEYSEKLRQARAMQCETAVDAEVGLQRFEHRRSRRSTSIRSSGRRCR